jgi:hypothetical protein
MPDGAARAIEDEKARVVAVRGRMLGDELGGELVLQLVRVHPIPTLPSRAMDADALERARRRLTLVAEGRVEPAVLEAALERAREGIEGLAQAAAQLESTLPQGVGDAVREGVRAEARPLARQVAELRGLVNGLVRRLERIEGDLLAERHARVDDLALLVELITSGWRSVDGRLDRLEARLAPAESRLARAGG